MTQLSKSQIKFLRGKAHDLRPVVMIGGNGLTENVLEELNRALDFHELVKVKVRAEEREEKHEIIESICKKTKAEKIQVIGHNLCLYKKSTSPKLILPK